MLDSITFLGSAESSPNKVDYLFTHENIVSLVLSNSLKLMGRKWVVAAHITILIRGNLALLVDAYLTLSCTDKIRCCLKLKGYLRWHYCSCNIKGPYCCFSQLSTLNWIGKYSLMLMCQFYYMPRWPKSLVCFWAVILS